MDNNKIELQSLVQEISNKALFIAKLQGNLYKVMNENDRLKKKLKAKDKPKSKGAK